jgi:hypothetical protein
MTHHWRITHEDDVARISRAGGLARMDIAGHGAWDAPAGDVNPRRYRIALAQQIRQDLWRALQSTRGFSPIVEVASDHSGQGGAPGAIRVMATAGGRLDVAQVPRAAMGAAIEALLSDRANHARWHKHAARRARPRPGDML